MGTNSAIESKEQFEALFESLVRGPLIGAGWTPSSGATLYRRTDQTLLCLSRVGGRMSRPGAIGHVLLARLNCLPTMDDKHHEYVREPHDYPFKLLPSELRTWVEGSPPEYAPQNLQYPREYLFWKDRPGPTVTRALEELRDSLLEIAVPWIDTLAPKALAHEIRVNGENAWVEGRWLDALDAAADLSPA